MIRKFLLLCFISELILAGCAKTTVAPVIKPFSIVVTEENRNEVVNDRKRNKKMKKLKKQRIKQKNR